MTLDDLRALADKFFEWPEGSGRQTVTTFSALLFAQHVLKLREMHEKSLGTNEKSLGAENSAGVDALPDDTGRDWSLLEATQKSLREHMAIIQKDTALLRQALEALEKPNAGLVPHNGEWMSIQSVAIAALRAALEQDEKPVAKIRTWHKGGEQNAELWDWDDGIETLPDGEHLLYASAPLRAALQQQAEPVAWMCPEDPERETAFNWKAGHCENCGKQRIPLYTALVQDQDPELSAALGWPGGISDPVLDRETLLQQVARLVERAHGIGEEK